MDSLEKYKNDIDLLYQQYLDGRYDIVTIAFTLVCGLVEHKDLSLIDSSPDEVVNTMYSHASGFKKEGSYIVVSNVGVTDHSDLFNELIVFLEQNDIAI
ncbi:hypothetical protein ACG1BZ_09650 [Microbulbifer sp. CNSA002]|uniref:hypothetical protein n=1 Tax=Microbulbifer sp. CNSA002 TaxID=3373604 RepID=UPI0039B587A4